MMPILYNNLLRITKRKNTVILYLFLTICAILTAVFLFGNSMSMARVAVQYQSVSDKIKPVSLHIIEVDEKPLKTDFITQRYDAYVEIGKDIHVVSMGSDESKKQIEQAFLHPDVQMASSSKRGVASTILGFMIMFVMMQSIYYMMMLQEDRENKILARIAVTPLSFIRYLMGQIIFAFLFTFIPVMFILTILSLMHVTIGISLISYAGLTALLSIFSISFASCIHAVFYGDTANMAGSAIIVLTSVLSGSFYSFEKGNKVLEMIISILPQKAFLRVVEGVERGKCMTYYGVSLWYLVLISLVFFIIAIWKFKKSYRHEESHLRKKSG